MFINVEKKLFESELKLMELLWENEPASAGKLSEIAAEKIGWNKNTTYTVITKLVAKGAIARSDPGFICTSIMKRDNAVKAETDSLLRHFYGGSKKALFSALLEDENLTDKDIKELKELIKSK
jgi:predicted transcriptional regulator